MSDIGMIPQTAISNSPVGRRLCFATWIITVVGLIVRLWLYFSNTPVWCDDANLARNILERSFGALAAPLSNSQAAPILFLWISKIDSLLIRNPDYSLRLLPLVCGLAAMILFTRLSLLMLSQAAAFAANVVFAFSSSLIYYCVTDKQYEVDVLVALLVIWLALKMFDRGLSVRLCVAFATVAAIGVGISHAAVFGVVATSAVITLREIKNHRRPATAWLVCGMALPLGSIALVYFLTLRGLHDNAYFNAFWADAFMPVSFRGLHWLIDNFYRANSFLFSPPEGWFAGERFSGMGGLFVAVGAVALYQKCPRLVWLLASPILLCLGASALHRYPFAVRMILFIMPTLCLLFGAGLAFVAEKTSRSSHQSIGILIYAAALLIPTLDGYAYFKNSGKFEESRPSLIDIGQHLQPNDVIFVYKHGEPAFHYYGHRYGLDNAEVHVGEFDAQYHPEKRLDDLKAVLGRPRVWVFFSHIQGTAGCDDEHLLCWELDHAGKRLSSCIGTGGSSYLYDLSTTPSPLTEVH